MTAESAPARADRMEFLARTRDELHAAITGVLGARRRVALVDFPNHDNSGDSAIYLGEHHVFGALGVELGYLADRTSFSPQRLRRAVGDAPVLIHGGGNFGDLWPTFQEHREHVIRSLPDNPIVQLPQSITFTDPSRTPALRALCERHGDVTVLTRDERSLVVARDALGLRARMSPDMAFGLGPLRTGVQPRVDVVWLARGDKEAGLDRSGLDRAQAALRRDFSVQQVDWSRESALRRRSRLGVRALGRLARDPALAPVRVDLLQRTPMHRLAVDRVNHAVAVLAAGRVVVTDRLHGHILCVLLGIPHVLLDNQHGKLSAYFDRWTRSSGVGHFARDPDDAAAQVARLLAVSPAERA